ncbi:MAG: CNNM domain-containing protein [Aliiglaciecola sp.]
MIDQGVLLLIIYVFVALGFSFLCSVAEAVLLSVSSGYISLSMNSGEASGKILHDFYEDINRPLSAILTLNTIAHTMGAAGAGAQAAVVFGDAYLGLASAVLTFLILVFSEIIPKTLGATYWRQLAPATAFFLKYLVLVLYPFVKMSAKLTGSFTEESPLKGLSRAELHAMAALSHKEGQLEHQEANILQSLLSLEALTVREAMTHRTVVFRVSEQMTVEEFYHKNASEVYSRIPVYEGDDSEQVSGFVMKADLLLAQARGNGDKTLATYRKDMVALLSSTPLSETFPHFLQSRSHMLLAIDEYGGLEGILTLEDLLESLLGIEIVDEKDKHISMKKVARLMWKRREKELFNIEQEKQ